MAEIKLEDLIARNQLAGDTILTIGEDGNIAMVIAATIEPPSDPVYGNTITINNIEVL